MPTLCRTLKVTRSGYYAWQGRVPGRTARRREQLVEQIRRVHADSRQRYGSPRVHRELRARGVRCCENTVAKLMRENGLKARTPHRFRPVTTDSHHDHAVAPNRLDRQFRVHTVNRVWTADITYIPTAQGWLYLAVVMDLASRRIVGWATADHLRASLTRRALQMALHRRRPPAGLLHHSDRGVQYAAGEYQALLRRHQLIPSMSRRGNCYDNAPTESFIGSLKTELVHTADFASRNDATRAIFQYLEVFYNRVRRHSSLGYQTPAEFEALSSRGQ